MAVTPNVAFLWRLMRTSVGVGLIVALFAACSSPSSPSTKSALSAKTVDARGLGAGWAGAGLYTRTTIPIPCIAGRCNGPEPSGNAFNSLVRDCRLGRLRQSCESRPSETKQNTFHDSPSYRAAVKRFGPATDTVRSRAQLRHGARFLRRCH